MTIGLLEIAITSIVTALSAGGAVVWYKEWGEQRAQGDDHSLDVVAIFRDRMQRVEDRVETQSTQIRALQQRESKLVAEVRVLVVRIDTLLRRLSQHEEISEKERREYLDLAVDLYTQEEEEQPVS